MSPENCGNLTSAKRTSAKRTSAKGTSAKRTPGKRTSAKFKTLPKLKKLKKVANFAEIEEVIICFYEVLVMNFDSIFLNFFIFRVLRFLQNEKQTVEK